MSNLTVSTLSGKDTNANTVSIAAGHMLSTPKFYSPGSVVQTKTVRSDNRITFTTQPSGNGYTMTELSIPFTPKFSTSLLVMQWMISCEVQQDQVFLIHRDGSLETTTGQQGFNSQAGNTRWSGLTSTGSYDQNDDSTPGQVFLQYFAYQGNTSQATWSPAVRSTNTGSYTFALNRTVGSSGQDSYENMVSTGIIWEIAQ